MKNLAFLYLIGAGILTGTLVANVITDHFHFELDRHTIEKEYRYGYEPSQKEVERARQREYLNSQDYKEYRDWCETHGLGYSEREKRQDFENGGTYDRDRGSSGGTVSSRERD